MKSHREGDDSRWLWLLVFGRIEVEEGFAESSLLFPIAYQVFDAILLMDCACEEILFMVQKDLEFFIGSIHRAFSTIKPFSLCKSVVLI